MERVLIMCLIVAAGMDMICAGVDERLPLPGYENSDRSVEAKKPPEPEPGYYEFIRKCSDKIGAQCGKEVYTSIFESGVVTDACCARLVKMGRHCHNTFVARMTTVPTIKANATRALPMSSDVWNGCVSVVQAAPSPTYLHD